MASHWKSVLSRRVLTLMNIVLKSAERVCLQILATKRRTQMSMAWSMFFSYLYISGLLKEFENHMSNLVVKTAVLIWNKWCNAGCYQMLYFLSWKKTEIWSQATWTLGGNHRTATAGAEARCCKSPLSIEVSRLNSDKVIYFALRSHT